MKNNLAGSLVLQLKSELCIGRVQLYITFPITNLTTTTTTDPGEVTSFPPHWHDQYLQADQQAVLTSLDGRGPYPGGQAGLMTSPPPNHPLLI